MEDTFNPATLSRADTSLGTRATPASVNKPSKPSQSFPRVDIEPLYQDLKLATGHHWSTYQDAFQRFMRGELSTREFGDFCDPFLLLDPSIEHAHNALICAIAYNSLRDAPEPGIAIWVSAASEKVGSSSTSKPAITSDAADQRLKAEIMGLAPRDRRRFKALAGDKTEDEPQAGKRSSYEDSFLASRIQAPETAPAGAGGLKTNLELEIKKGYAQPLFVEAQEFPDVPTMLQRVQAKCYEAGIAGGTSLQCAELVTTAAEMHIKEFTSKVVRRVRTNMPLYDNEDDSGVYTAKYKRQLMKEEIDFKAGRLQRGRDDDLLPIQAKFAYSRRPIGLADLQLANRVGPKLWNGMPLLGMRVNEAFLVTNKDEWRAAKQALGTENGIANEDHVDEMEVDDEDTGWEGTSRADQQELSNTLASILSAA